MESHNQIATTSPNNAKQCGSKQDNKEKEFVCPEEETSAAKLQVWIISFKHITC